MECSSAQGSIDQATAIKAQNVLVRLVLEAFDEDRIAKKQGREGTSVTALRPNVKTYIVGLIQDNNGQLPGGIGSKKCSETEHFAIAIAVMVKMDREALGSTAAILAVAKNLGSGSGNEPYSTVRDAYYKYRKPHHAHEVKAELSRRRLDDCKANASAPKLRAFNATSIRNARSRSKAKLPRVAASTILKKLYPIL